MRRRGRRLRGWVLRPVGTLVVPMVAGALWSGPLSGQDAVLTSLIGEVVDMAGVGLEGAAIRLEPVGDTPGVVRITVSNEAGVFAIPSLFPGDYIVSVTNLGFADIVDTVSLSESAPLEIFVRMSVDPIDVDPMLVEVGSRPIGPLVGFDQRRRTMAGTFFTREAIEAADVMEFSDLMRLVPGMRVVPTGAFGHRLLMRGCRPDLWLDGTFVGANADVDSFLRPRDLEGIEIYRGSVVPGQFGTTQCGAVVAWSRRGQPEVKESNLKRQFIIAGSLVALFVVFRR